MSFRKFANFLLFIISILIINLLTTLIGDFMIKFMNGTHPFKATLIGMVMTVFVLYPAYSRINNFSDYITRRIFTAGTNAGGKFFGILWAFLVAFGILFVCYLYLWYGVKIWTILN